MRPFALLSCVALAACGDPATCASTDGTWGECSNGGPVCADGAVSNEPQPAVCADGCACPASAPVWDSERGCVTVEACEG